MMFVIFIRDNKSEPKTLEKHSASDSTNWVKPSHKWRTKKANNIWNLSLSQSAP